jgi:CO/xanthine dehydrogenase Mo-binding subunit
MSAGPMRGVALTSALTADAREALEGQGFSRRQFLERSGAVIVAFGAGMAGAGVAGGRPAAAQGFNGAGSERLDSWLAIGADGRVTAYTGKCELGQGLFTAQAQLVAEELGVPIADVTLLQCDTALTPDQGTTSGAQSHPANFNRANLALAAATAREALIRLASARLGVGADQLRVADGRVRTVAVPVREVAFADLIGGRRFDLALDPAAPRRPPRDWVVLGTPVPRLDMPAMVAGRFEFVHNVRVPGMLHGAVIRPPAIGARLATVDESSVRDLPGLVRVVRRNDFLGVVAEKPWQALQAARALRATWTEGAGLPPRDRLYEDLRARTPRRDTLAVDSGDVDARLAAAATVVRATYRYPYQMHGSLGTSCAVADVGADRATIWSATQAVYPMSSSVATLLGLERGRVRVIFRMGSGCYGINGADTVTYDAALLSQAAGRPVRVQLSRDAEMAWENYGLAYVIDQRAGLDPDGSILAWDYEAWNPTRGGRPGAGAPGNVITGFLAGFRPAPFVARTPAPRPAGAFANRSNVVPSYVTGCVGNRCGGTGTVRSERMLSHVVESPFWTGPLRSPSRLQNTFAHECFMDEIAATAGADPVAYRLRHLRDSRLRAVVSAAAEAARWEPRRSPGRDVPRTGVAAGRGIACVLYEGDNGYCAAVAEAEVDQDTGRVLVTRCVVALDCGPVSNPDGVRNQIEGGVLQGISRALREDVTWDARRITSVDWRTYPAWSLADPAPAVESVLVRRDDAEACGAGETSVTVMAAAIGNAVFDATGARLREVPFTPDRVRAALAAR